MSIGNEIHPSETLVFRQDKFESLKLNGTACSFTNCWSSVTGRTAFCMPHLKQSQMKILRLYQNIYKKVIKEDPKNWVKLVKYMQVNTLKEDRSLIKIEQFERVLAKFRIKL